MHGVYHICGEGVLEDERYKEFMNGFSDETHVSRSVHLSVFPFSPRRQHIVSSKAHTPNRLTHQQTGLMQGKLNQLDLDMFPIPKYDLEPVTALSGMGVLFVTHPSNSSIRQLLPASPILRRCWSPIFLSRCDRCDLPPRMSWQDRGISMRWR